MEKPLSEAAVASLMGDEDAEWQLLHRPGPDAHIYGVAFMGLGLGDILSSSWRNKGEDLLRTAGRIRVYTGGEAADAPDAKVWFSGSYAATEGKEWQEPTQEIAEAVAEADIFKCMDVIKNKEAVFSRKGVPLTMLRSLKPRMYDFCWINGNAVKMGDVLKTKPWAHVQTIPQERLGKLDN